MSLDFFSLRRKILLFQNNTTENADAWTSARVSISLLVSPSFSELYVSGLHSPLVFICFRNMAGFFGTTKDVQTPEWCDRHHYQRFTFPLETVCDA